MFKSRGVSNAASLVAGNLGRTVLAAPMMLIRPDADKVDAAYLQWFINQSSTQKILSAQAAGTAVKMISKVALEQLEIAIPPLESQRQIVEIGQIASLEARITTELMDRRKVLIERILMREAQNVR
jgi:restriction endonuclease S subunit